MWKRGGRSYALDRAEALLSAKRSSRGDGESAQGSAADAQFAVGGSMKARSSFPNAHITFSDMSDLSSASSFPECGAAAVDTAAAQETDGRENDSTEDLRHQSPLGAGGSRFLKKTRPPATNSHQSPASKNQMQALVPRNVSSSVQGSQTAALNRLAQIESRLSSCKPSRPGSKPAGNLYSDVVISPAEAAPYPEAPVELSALSSRDQSSTGKRFLKKNTSASPQAQDIVVRSRSRAAGVGVPLVGLGTKRVVSVVSLESDEEDMRKLLGDSIDNSFLIPGKPSAIRTSDLFARDGFMFSTGSQRVVSSPPPTVVAPPSFVNTSPPHSPSPPPCHGSPFRFIGQVQAHFSPSVPSPSPTPPHFYSGSPTRLNSPHRAGSSQRSISSMSGCSEVLSLEELFPVGSSSDGPHSEMSEVSSEDFKIKVMTLDDLGFSEKTSGKKAELLANDEEQEGEEEKWDYQSDFENDSTTEPDASLVSEHLQGSGDEEEVVSEVREEASGTSCVRTDEDFSRTLSDTSHSYTSPTSDHSQTLSRSRNTHSRSSGFSRPSGSSRSTGSQSSQMSSPQSRWRTSTRKVLKEVAVQTQPDPLIYTWPTGMSSLGHAVDTGYTDPTPVVAHTLDAEMVEALSTFNPAAFAVNELLKQQLSMIRRFIESSQHLHTSLVQGLEPPNYRYTTLEATKEYIRKLRPTAEEEALQEMRHCS